jgi:signal transduction histidine kinase/ActR/RegA family two-component response regulator
MSFSIHDFLRDQRDAIVRAWEASVEEEPRVISLAGSLLRNHIPELLDELADWMELDISPGTARMRVASTVHAADRLEHKFEIAQLIHEVRLLRTTILRLVLAEESSERIEHGTIGMADRVVELARLNAGLDFAVADAVEYFATERERRLAEVTSREISRVQEQNRRQSDFLAVLSHELRNPLAPILNSLHILTHAEANTEQFGHATNVIQRQTQHLTRLVDDLLDITRISHGKIPLHPERFDLRDVVRTTCDDHRSLVEQRDLTLRLEVPGGPVWIDGDRTRIAQVTSNLLQNAVKFTARGGILNVAIAVHEQRASLRVKDSGIGLEPDLLETLFEPFIQGVPARQKGGLGLGLALVKGLVTLHKGTVSARSGGAGCGSEFIVELPLAPATPHAPRETPTASPSRLVVLIEDSADNADTLARVLELNGHRVQLARDGKSGLALAVELQPDVVLCDIGLPDIDGYEVARELRMTSRLVATRLVALSGYAQPEDRQRSQEAGFDAHLVKPVVFAELNEILTAARS